MKIAFLALATFLVAHSAYSKNIVKDKVHILPDAPGWVYLDKYSSDVTRDSRSSVAPSVRLGERNLAWLNHMNSLRPSDQKLVLTKPGDLTGIPIEEAKGYSDQTVNTNYKELESQMPAEMKAVLFSSIELPANPPVSDELYIKWAKEVDKNYQTAVRWTMMQPWLGELALGRYEDLRGFYFLSKKTENVESTLRSYDTLPEDQKKQISEWLLQMCQNSEGLNSGCARKVENSLQSKSAYEFYLKYLPGSQKIWDSYFSLHNPRHEVVWNSSNPFKMLVPFQDPEDSTILDFLKLNIEDEWKWDQWNLNLDFRKSAEIHVEFQSGVTPHVNGLGGDTIVMDKNAPLTEWDVQWTIRHEFGHVLGFTDCYLEFYEPAKKEIMNYQLDVENLMCSRKGRMQKTHFETLKKSYYK